MARSIQDIQADIIQRKEQEPALAVLTSTSVTAIWRLWTYIVAVAIWTLETLFDYHRTDMQKLYNTRHPHTLGWYTDRALAFLLGVPLQPFSIEFDTANMTDEQIAQSKIVTYAAAVRSRYSNERVYLQLKVAKGTSELLPLDSVELQAFTAYMNAIQDAGVDLICTSKDADRIVMSWRIFYNPQLIDSNGVGVGGTGIDVRQSIIDYLKNLTFNGIYVPTFHIDAIQRITGVQVPVIESVQVAPSGGTLTDVPPEGTIAAAGWFKFYADLDLTVTFIPFDLNNV